MIGSTPSPRSLIRSLSSSWETALKRLEFDIQKYELKLVKAVDCRLAGTLKTHIPAVTVTFTKESVIHFANCNRWANTRPSLPRKWLAKARGIEAHNIPPLCRAGLIKTLGRPDRYCVKHYSRDALGRNLVGPGWLGRFRK